MSSKRIVQPTSPSGIPLRKIFNPVFPLSLRDSLHQWTRRSQLKQAEADLLNCVGLDPARPTGNFSTRTMDVPVEVVPHSVKSGSTKSDIYFMNELELRSRESSNPENEKHLVLVHGYGASKGYFYRNFTPLAARHTVHALDWLGYGLSTRPTPKLPRFSSVSDGVNYGENWFLTPFESWRKQRKIEKMSIVAHSLGAYLACAYASLYPERVEKLVLVSPASVNRTPASAPGDQLYPLFTDQERRRILSPITSQAPNVPVWFKHLWERHWSPFSLVRKTGPWGPKLTSGWTTRRFARQPEKDQLALQNYSYRMFNAKGSGEYLLNYFLAAGGVGRWPLAERLEKLKCPSLWLYGDHDWMDSKGGEEAVKRLRSAGQFADLVIVPHSGHHLYLDNERYFNNSVSHFL